MMSGNAEPKVQVLMSAYNGEKFLEQQIDSLLNQTYPNIEILIRDDGSKDATVGILKRYESMHDNIRVFVGENVGVTDSFFALLEMSDADFIAFCDQDDIWLPEKVRHGVDMIRDMDGPVLYCSNKILVDADNELIAGNTGRELRPDFRNALVECICTGCTIIMNKPLSDDVRNHIPKHAIIHDWWCYLTASYVGQVVFDKDSFIWYRQHGNNVLGQSATFVGQVKAKARYLKDNKGKLYAQLCEFRSLYRGQQDKDRLVDRILDAKKVTGRLPVVFGRAFYRQEKLDDVITRVLFLIDRML